MKTARITFDDWSGLRSGRIARIHGINGCSVEYHRIGRRFVMECFRTGQSHTLADEHTDSTRLDSHFHGFQWNNWKGAN